MMSNEPKFHVAILLSVYNGGKYISEQLGSLILQEYDSDKYELHIYIRDDGSTDNSSDFISSYVENYNFIHLIGDGKNVGCTRSFFQLLYSVKADYYFFCDQDDYWLPNKVEQSLRKIVTTSKPTLVHSDLTVVDSSLSVINNSFYKYQRLSIDSNLSKKASTLQNRIVGCTACINQSLKDEIDFDFVLSSESNIAMHDWWIGLIANYLGQVIYINEPLIKYRQHGSNVLGAQGSGMRRVIKLFFSKAPQERVDNFTLKVSNQASAFLSNYFSRLSNDDILLLQRASLFSTKLGIKNMIYLMFFNGFYLSGVDRNFAVLYSSFIHD